MSATMLRTLPSGRQVFDTGRVMVGLLYEPRPRDQGTSADLMQRLWMTPEPPREWHECPAVVKLKPSLWERLVRWWWEWRTWK